MHAEDMWISQCDMRFDLLGYEDASLKNVDGMGTRIDITYIHTMPPLPPLLTNIRITLNNENGYHRNIKYFYENQIH